MTKLQAEMGDVDQLAQIIRKVDGAHSLGAGALAEAVIGELKRLRAAHPMSAPNDKQKCWCGMSDASAGFHASWCPMSIKPSCAPRADGSAAEVSEECPRTRRLVDELSRFGYSAANDRATTLCWELERENKSLRSRVAELERVLRRLEIELRRFASGGTRPAPYQVEEMHKWAFDVLSKGAQT